MWSGALVAGPFSDQHSTGYAMRWWGPHAWRASGHLPLWNPYVFAGAPTFAGFGDLFYPTAWLRLFLPTAFAIDLGFVVHFLLAGFCAYRLLRLLGLSWLASLIGGTSYQLSGVVISLVSPGHDGKLFVTALLPLMLIGLLLGIRRRRWEGFALLGIATGLALLSPQYQMTQYALVTSGLFALYLAFVEPEGLTPRERWLALAGAIGGLVLGFGVSMIQVLPFFHYIPVSPRAETGGYEWSTSYAMPWSHIPELVIAGFNGAYETYWGPNFLKLHSEYLGLPVVALAVLGAGSDRRKLVGWLGGIGILFLLVSLGGGTPFYRLWYAIVPYVNKTRAPGMALYIVALAVSGLAALGVNRLERGAGKRVLQTALGAAGFAGLLAAAGVFGSIAEGLARTAQAAGGRASLDAAVAAQASIRLGALGSAVGLALVAGVGLAFLAGRIRGRAFAILLTLIIGLDLYRAGRGFWHWSRPEQEIFMVDPIVAHLKQVAPPYRLLDFGGFYPAGGSSSHALMRHEIPQVLGSSSTEIRFYDDLLGGRNVWRNLQFTNLWQLLAVRYVLLGDTTQVPGYHRVMGPVTTASGRAAYLYEADTVPPYARVVPAAVKGDTGRIIPTLIDPRLDYGRLVLFDSSQTVNPLPVLAMPEPSPSRALVTQWTAGRMAITLDPPPPAASYLLIAENWYPDWHATVDGQSAPVLRGDHAFLTVPVAAGSKRVELEFSSRGYARGRMVTWISLVLLAGWAGAGLASRRARRGG